MSGGCICEKGRENWNCVYDVNSLTSSSTEFIDWFLCFAWASHTSIACALLSRSRSLLLSVCTVLCEHCVLWMNQRPRTSSSNFVYFIYGRIHIYNIHIDVRWKNCNLQAEERFILNIFIEQIMPLSVYQVYMFGCCAGKKSLIISFFPHKSSKKICRFFSSFLSYWACIFFLKPHRFEHCPFISVGNKQACACIDCRR